MELGNEAHRLAPAIRYSIHLDGLVTVLVAVAVVVLALPWGKGYTDTFVDKLVLAFALVEVEVVEQEVPM